MSDISEPYVMGLLADLEPGVVDLETSLRTGRERAARVDAELSNLLRRLDETKAALAEAQTQSGKTTFQINENNLQIASLHQDIAGIRRRADDIKAEMDRVGPGAIQRRLRRERAKFLVQVEDRETEIETLRSDVEQLRSNLEQLEAQTETLNDRMRAIIDELDQLQGQLPSPYLYTQLVERTAARAHCRFFLDRDGGAWRAELRRAIDTMLTLHTDLRRGKYRLDRNSDLIGGRATATAEALYGAVAISEYDLARELFATATDPNLFFHHIFNVFRVWCLGLLLADRRRELSELLRRHQYAPGLRGGYVWGFIGLLAPDERRLQSGLKTIVRQEWELWQDPSLVRGAGVVNLGALAMAKLAVDRGLRVISPGPTVPAELLPHAPANPKTASGRRQRALQNT